MGSYSSDVKAKKLTTSPVMLSAGRTRIRQIQVNAAGSGSPQVVVKDGAGGTVILDLEFATDTNTSVNIPADGILSVNDPQFVLTNIDSITVFYA